uniref:CIA30 domain-containing protein n=1 Tax=Caenorhabditis tropicalis TaxID=1561998 RepID=A0A1I7TT78_9PELO
MVISGTEFFNREAPRWWDVDKVLVNDRLSYKGSVRIEFLHRAGLQRGVLQLFSLRPDTSSFLWSEKSGLGHCI